jgi:predicted RNase H-like HicB family nuclease
MTRKKVWTWSARWETAVVVEKYPDGYVAYPLNMQGAVVGEGDTFEEALADVKSAITFHIETFGLHPQE